MGDYLPTDERFTCPVDGCDREVWIVGRDRCSVHHRREHGRERRPHPCRRRGCEVEVAGHRYCPRHRSGSCEHLDGEVMCGRRTSSGHRYCSTHRVRTCAAEDCDKDAHSGHRHCSKHRGPRVTKQYRRCPWPRYLCRYRYRRSDPDGYCRDHREVVDAFGEPESLDDVPDDVMISGEDGLRRMAEVAEDAQVGWEPGELVREVEG